MQSNNLSDNPDNITLVYRYPTIDVEFRYKQGVEIVISLSTEQHKRYATPAEYDEVLQSLDRFAYNFPSLVPSLPQWARKLINVL